MIITEIQRDFNDIRTNPTVMVTKGTSRKQYGFPDPESYFILSNAGKEYSIQGNNAILLNLQKGYFASSFTLNLNQANVMSIASAMFQDSKTLDEASGRALNAAIQKTGLMAPTLPNRL